MREKELARVKITQFFLFRSGTIESRAWLTIFDECVKNWFAFLGRLSPSPEEHFTTHVHSVNFQKILNLCNSTVFSISGHVVGLDTILWRNSIPFPVLVSFVMSQENRTEITKSAKSPSPFHSAHRFTCELLPKSNFLSEPTNQLRSIWVASII